VFRKQCHFPRNHAELWATAALGRCCWRSGRRRHRVASRNGFFVSAQVQVNRLAADIAEDQRMPLWLGLLRAQNGDGDLMQWAGGKAPPVQESGVRDWQGVVHAAYFIRVKLHSQITSG